MEVKRGPGQPPFLPRLVGPTLGSSQFSTAMARLGAGGVAAVTLNHSDGIVRAKILRMVIAALGSREVLNRCVCHNSGEAAGLGIRFLSLRATGTLPFGFSFCRKSRHRHPPRGSRHSRVIPSCLYGAALQASFQNGVASHMGRTTLTWYLGEFSAFNYDPLDPLSPHI
jgi:hypothetical protein